MARQMQLAAMNSDFMKSGGREAQGERQRDLLLDPFQRLELERRQKQDC